MPIFEYQCEQCEKQFEKLVFAGDDEKDIGPPIKKIRVPCVRREWHQ